jgi:hypothetical protein
LALAGGVCSALALERTFDNQAGNQLWLTAANWNPDGLPGQFDPVRIDGGRAVTLDGNAGWVHSGTIGGSNGLGVLNVNPGGIAYGVSFRNPTNSLLIGGATNASAAASEYNHSTGTMDTIGDFIIGGRGGRAVARFYAGNIWVGGTLRLGSYLYAPNAFSTNAVLKLVGGGGGFTQLPNLEIGPGGTLSFEFNGGNSLKTMHVTSNVTLLPGATLTVDGTGYSGGTTTKTLIQGATLTGSFSKINFTNFPASLAPNVVHANGKVTLLINENTTLPTIPAGLRLVAPAQYSFGCAPGPEGSVLFAEYPSQQLRRWKTNGQVEVVANGIPGPFNVASDSSGNVFIGLELGDVGNASRILRLAANGSQSYIVTNLTRPRQLATDAAGNVYFATESPPRIRRWNKLAGTVDILGMDNIAVNPEGVAVAADGTVYFNSYGNPEAGLAGTLQRIATNGTITLLMSALATGRGRGLALDEPNGCLYLCSEADLEDHGNSGRLIRYRISDGTWTHVLEGLDYPQFPCKGSDGRIYFTLARDDWLAAYDPAATTLAGTWPGASNGMTGISGGTWGPGQPGSRLALTVGGTLAFDGNMQATVSGGTVHGWLRIPASQFALSTNQLAGSNGRVFQPNPNSGIYELPAITYAADAGSCLVAALALREHTGVRWPMANPGTTNETPAAGFAEAPTDFLIHFAWNTNDRAAAVLSPAYNEPGGALTILKGSGLGWHYSDQSWLAAGQTWLNGGRYHAAAPSVWAEVELGAFSGKSKYIYVAWHVNGSYRPHATHYTIYDLVADKLTVLVDQTKHADGIHHGNDTFSGWRLLGNGKINLTPSTRLWVHLDSSVAANEFLQSDAVLLAEHPIVDNIAPGATNNFDFNPPLSVASSGPTGVGHHWGMQGLGGQSTGTTNHSAEIRFERSAFADAPTGYYNVEVSWTYFAGEGWNVTNARYALNGTQLPEAIDQNRAATNQGGLFEAGNSLGSWSGFQRLSEPCYFAGTNPIAVQLEYNSALHAGRLAVDMVRFLPLGCGEDADSDGLPDWWMTENFGHRTARAGDWSRPGDAPAGDGIANLVKYALGLNAVTFGSQGRLIAGTTSATNHRFLSVTYTRPDPPPTGLTYAVEQSPSLCSSLWTTNGTIVLSNAVNSGLRTITTRDKEPIGATPQRFLRFKLSPP